MSESNLERAAMELARRLARKVFAGDYDLEEKVADTQSVAWEFAHNAPPAATPRSVADYAILRVKGGHQFGRSTRSIEKRGDPRSRKWRPKRVEGFDLGDFAGRDDDPAEIAAAKIDTETWWMGLGRRDRQIAEMLAVGNTTKETALAFHVSQGRISQVRGELHLKYQAFQGEY